MTVMTILLSKDECIHCDNDYKNQKGDYMKDINNCLSSLIKEMVGFNHNMKEVDDYMTWKYDYMIDRSNCMIKKATSYHILYLSPYFLEQFRATLLTSAHITVTSIY